MREICQSEIPVTPWREERTRRLPGVSPLTPADWILVDEVYAEQMAYREELIAEKGEAVLKTDPSGLAAAHELLDMLLDHLPTLPGFTLSAEGMTRPDGKLVPIDREDPMRTASLLTQEDMQIMQRNEGDDEHRIVAGVLCFPASWTFLEKFMKPLIRIHVPVGVYDDNIAPRVQRLFDGIQPDKLLMRANYLLYATPELYHPVSEKGKERNRDPGGRKWLRSERQVMRRLPKTRAVVFTVHTYVLPFETLDPSDQELLLKYRG